MMKDALCRIHIWLTRKSGNWWIGWIEEVPGVICQEPTREALLHSLKVTLKEALDFPRHTEIADQLV